jgi:hypothetical protein
MVREITIAQFIQAIKCLPSDKPITDSRTWYKTQKEHWIGWLSEYDTPGAYGRKCCQNRDAKFAYNHTMCPEMLLYLIKAIPVSSELIETVEKEYKNEANWTSLPKIVGAIRKIVPWQVISQTIKIPKWYEKPYISVIASIDVIRPRQRKPSTEISANVAASNSIATR